jgi:polyribonucleotide nucleotidyltransferase
MVGTVTIGSVDKGSLEEAERQIMLFLNPPTANVGETYPGRVVNITKFGAFVNILPGRDGLLHISKIGQGKRIDRVEDVFNLGDEVQVKVDDVDPNGKVSLSLAGAVEIPDSAVSSGGGDRDRAPRERAPRDDAPAAAGDRESVSFEDAFDAEVRQEFGDLGPAATSGDAGGGRGGERRGGGGRGGERRGGGRSRR